MSIMCCKRFVTFVNYCPTLRINNFLMINVNFTINYSSLLDICYHYLPLPLHEHWLQSFA